MSWFPHIGLIVVIDSYIRNRPMIIGTSDNVVIVRFLETMRA
jgi:hypothetical protein